MRRPGTPAGPFSFGNRPTARSATAVIEAATAIVTPGAGAIEGDLGTITIVSPMNGPMNDPGVAASTPVGLRFELFVQDVKASVRFYQATLGLEPPATWSADGYVPVSAGSVTVGLQRLTNLPAGHHFSPSRLAGPRGVGLEIVVEVDDVDLAYAKALPGAEHCGGSVEPLADQPWGLRDFRLVDPDGYYLRITSRQR